LISAGTAEAIGWARNVGDKQIQQGYHAKMEIILKRKGKNIFISRP
jgi:hypothetical protein